MRASRDSRPRLFTTAGFAESTRSEEGSLAFVGTENRAIFLNVCENLYNQAIREKACDVALHGYYHRVEEVI